MNVYVFNLTVFRISGVGNNTYMLIVLTINIPSIMVIGGKNENIRKIKFTIENYQSEQHGCL